MPFNLGGFDINEQVLTFNGSPLANDFSVGSLKDMNTLHLDIYTNVFCNTETLVSEVTTGFITKICQYLNTRSLSDVIKEFSERSAMSVREKKHQRPLNISTEEFNQKNNKYKMVSQDPLTQKNSKPSSWRKDINSILILFFLYVLQGVPLGLAGSIPMLLQSRQVSYRDQALFSFVYWPFSLKLFWAPIVDSIFISSLGRRKSWLVPSQYLISIFMIFLSYHITDYLGDKSTPPKIYFLTFSFFILNFLAATQDIAVDGWALTMLSKGNVGWASTCNSVGQTAGYFLGNVLFLALESPTFCNKYLRSVPSSEGIITLAGFLFICGIIFWVTTSLILVFKREKPETDSMNLGIVATYKVLIKVIQLPAVFSLSLIFLTSKIILPLVISRYTNGPRPMDIYLKAFPCRLLMAIPYAGLVYMANHVQTEPGVFPAYFYLITITFYALHQVTLYCMFVSGMAMSAKVSDPAIGGSYMTLLNTVNNLGGNWPATISLWLVESLTIKTCSSDNSSCSDAANAERCTGKGGTCLTIIDGYYIEIVFCLVIGFLWSCTVVLFSDNSVNPST
ncbi:acetyl-coenzyme A transporter 1-like [Octopus vulgaris]|uniref:Acetyl-coenzyme A transporter 1-like n=1 Tax=Octopus vulgaris TaxID=6645 RepID=A0AA36FE50_OCTVU|nr:acetyl-coenzyme A transporter 1-like [Octopus vulgaris]